MKALRVFFCFIFVGAISAFAAGNNDVKMVSYFPVPYSAYNTVNVSDDLQMGLSKNSYVNVGSSGMAQDYSLYTPKATVPSHEGQANLQLNNLTTIDSTTGLTLGGRVASTESDTANFNDLYVDKLNPSGANSNLRAQTKSLKATTSFSMFPSKVSNSMLSTSSASDSSYCKDSNGNQIPATWKRYKVKANPDVYRWVLACGQEESYNKACAEIGGCWDPTRGVCTCRSYQGETSGSCGGSTGVADQIVFAFTGSLTTNTSSCSYKTRTATCINETSNASRKPSWSYSGWTNYSPTAPEISRNCSGADANYCGVQSRTRSCNNPRTSELDKHSLNYSGQNPYFSVSKEWPTPATDSICKAKPDTTAQCGTVGCSYLTGTATRTPECGKNNGADTVWSEPEWIVDACTCAVQPQKPLTQTCTTALGKTACGPEQNRTAECMKAVKSASTCSTYSADKGWKYGEWIGPCIALPADYTDSANCNASKPTPGTYGHTATPPNRLVDNDGHTSTKENTQATRNVTHACQTNAAAYNITYPEWSNRENACYQDRQETLTCTQATSGYWALSGGPYPLPSTQTVTRYFRFFHGDTEKEPPTWSANRNTCYKDVDEYQSCATWGGNYNLGGNVALVTCKYYSNGTKGECRIKDVSDCYHEQPEKGECSTSAIGGVFNLGGKVAERTCRYHPNAAGTAQGNIDNCTSWDINSKCYRELERNTTCAIQTNNAFSSGSVPNRTCTQYAGQAENCPNWNVCDCHKDLEICDVSGSETRNCSSVNARTCGNQTRTRGCRYYYVVSGCSNTSAPVYTGFNWSSWNGTCATMPNDTTETKGCGTSQLVAGTNPTTYSIVDTDGHTTGGNATRSITYSCKSGSPQPTGYNTTYGAWTLTNCFETHDINASCADWGGNYNEGGNVAVITCDFYHNDPSKCVNPRLKDATACYKTQTENGDCYNKVGTSYCGATSRTYRAHYPNGTIKDHYSSGGEDKWPTTNCVSKPGNESRSCGSVTSGTCGTQTATYSCNTSTHQWVLGSYSGDCVTMPTPNPKYETETPLCSTVTEAGAYTKGNASRTKITTYTCKSNGSAAYDTNITYDPWNLSGCYLEKTPCDVSGSENRACSVGTSGTCGTQTRTRSCRYYATATSTPNYTGYNWSDWSGSCTTLPGTIKTATTSRVTSKVSCSTANSTYTLSDTSNPADKYEDYACRSNGTANYDLTSTTYGVSTSCYKWKNCSESCAAGYSGTHTWQVKWNYNGSEPNCSTATKFNEVNTCTATSCVPAGRTCSSETGGTHTLGSLPCNPPNWGSPNGNCYKACTVYRSCSSVTPGTCGTQTGTGKMYYGSAECQVDSWSGPCETLTTSPTSETKACSDSSVGAGTYTLGNATRSISYACKSDGSANVVTSYGSWDRSECYKWPTSPDLETQSCGSGKCGTQSRTRTCKIMYGGTSNCDGISWSAWTGDCCALPSTLNETDTGSCSTADTDGHTEGGNVATRSKTTTYTCKTNGSCGSDSSVSYGSWTLSSCYKLVDGSEACPSCSAGYCPTGSHTWKNRWYHGASSANSTKYNESNTCSCYQCTCVPTDATCSSLTNGAYPNGTPTCNGTTWSTESCWKTGTEYGDCHDANANQCGSRSRTYHEHPSGAKDEYSNWSGSCTNNPGDQTRACPSGYCGTQSASYTCNTSTHQWDLGSYSPACTIQKPSNYTQSAACNSSQLVAGTNPTSSSQVDTDGHTSGSATRSVSYACKSDGSAAYDTTYGSWTLTQNGSYGCYSFEPEAVNCNTLSGYEAYSGTATRTCRHYHGASSNTDCGEWDYRNCTPPSGTACSTVTNNTYQYGTATFNTSNHTWDLSGCYNVVFNEWTDSCGDGMCGSINNVADCRLYYPYTTSTANYMNLIDCREAAIAQSMNCVALPTLRELADSSMACNATVRYGTATCTSSGCTGYTTGKVDSDGTHLLGEVAQARLNTTACASNGSAAYTITYGTFDLGAFTITGRGTVGCYKNVAEEVDCNTLSGFSGYTGKATRTCRLYHGASSNSNCSSWNTDNCVAPSSCSAAYPNYPLGDLSKGISGPTYSGWYPLTDHNSVGCHKIMAGPNITCAAAAGSSYTNDGQYTEGGNVVTTTYWAFSNADHPTVAMDRSSCYTTDSALCTLDDVPSSCSNPKAFCIRGEACGLKTRTCPYGGSCGDYDTSTCSELPPFQGVPSLERNGVCPVGYTDGGATRSSAYTTYECTNNQVVTTNHPAGPWNYDACYYTTTTTCKALSLGGNTTVTVKHFYDGTTTDDSATVCATAPVLEEFCSWTRACALIDSTYTGGTATCSKVKASNEVCSRFPPADCAWRTRECIADGGFNPGTPSIGQNCSFSTSCRNIELSTTNGGYTGGTATCNYWADFGMACGSDGDVSCPGTWDTSNCIEGSGFLPADPIDPGDTCYTWNGSCPATLGTTCIAECVYNQTCRCQNGTTIRCTKKTPCYAIANP